MKKSLPALLALLLISLVACGTPTSTTSSPTTLPTQLITPTQTETEPVSVVTFADPALEVIVRGAMGKSSGDITVAEAKTVTCLNLAYEKWQKYISGKEPISSIAGLENFTSLESLDLSGNTITDITPLSALANLKALILTGCAVENYAPLANLTNLRVLMLDHSTIADPTPLLALTSLKCLYLEGSQIGNYFPLAEIRENLELADFDIAYTLAELGFTFNDGDKLALYQTDKCDIRINHLEWGNPSRPDWGNCIVVVTGAETGYKNAIGFYPEHNAYVAWLFDVNTEENYTYVYDLDEPNSFSDHASLEAIVREAFVDVDEEDVLFTPFRFFDNMIHEALGIPVEILYNMPFDETIVLQSPYEKHGFEFLDYRGTYTYKEGSIELSIHKPQWDDNVDAKNKLGWNMEYIDSDVKGYHMLILYFAEKNFYIVSLEKDGTEIKFDYYPATNKFEYNPQSIEPFRSALNEAFSTQGNDFLKMPMTIFKDNVQGRFGMSVEELYALSKN